jgi:uncharacterized protein (DUF1501 family)
MTMRFGRRAFVRSLALAPAWSAALGSVGVRAAFARTGSEGRFVFVLLRGGLDGLSLAPAYGDPSFEPARAGIALLPPGEPGGALRLDDTFALHPRLPDVHPLWAKRELIVLHAICSPYRERSHFDAQNVLESGGTAPYALRTGWLNRALAGLPRRDSHALAGPRGSNLGVALGSAMPVCMRGAAPVATWSPSLLPAPDASLLDRIARMYAPDDALSRALAEARAANALAGDADARGGFAAVMRAAAAFLREPDGPSVAMVESTGWDTHAAQEAPQGALARNLAQLNAGLRTLREELGATWSRTAVLVLTEFGRTVAMNGSRGTDHGTGGAGLLLGGAVAGGRVLADWPGLGRAQLFEGRDLRATLDTRAVAKGVLRDHLGVPEAHLESVVFPESGEHRPVAGLIRSEAHPA